MTAGRRLALGIALAGTLPCAIGAHSGLRFSSPADGATLGDSPAQVQLTFLEQPEAALSTIRVVDTSGATYQTGVPQPAAGDPLSLTVGVRPMAKGVYTVHWRVVSAVDGHASSGALAFGVLVAPARSLDSTGSGETNVRTSDVLSRAAFLTGLVMLLGAAAAHVARFGLGRELTMMRAGWVVTAAGLVLLAFAQKRTAETAWMALAGTAIGRALIGRAVAIGVAGVALGLAVWADRTGRVRLTLIAVVGVIAAALSAIAIHAVAGHAGAGRWPVLQAAGFQTVHIAAVGVWLGGLAALLVAVQGAPSDLKATAVTRFSTVAAGGLFVVLATGIARSTGELTAWGDLVSTSYGRVLLLKAVLLSGLAGLGALNRFRHVPHAAAVLGPLRQTAGAELALAALALAATGWLGELAPPAAGQTIAGIEASGVDFGTTVRVRLTAASDYPGLNRFTVQVNDYDSAAPVRAARVSLRFVPMDDPGAEATTLALAEADGAYTGSGANLGFEGRWRIGVLVESGGSSTEVPLEIETRSTPQQVSIERVPGEAPKYTVLAPRLGLVRFSPNPERPGASEVVVSCFDLLGNHRPAEHMVILTVGADGAWRQHSVRRLEEHRFAAAIELRPGPNDIVAIARGADGSRLRGAVRIDLGTAPDR